MLTHVIVGVGKIFPMNIFNHCMPSLYNVIVCLGKGRKKVCDYYLHNSEAKMRCERAALHSKHQFIGLDLADYHFSVPTLKHKLPNILMYMLNSWISQGQG